MGARGRKSVAQRTAVVIEGGFGTKRIEPPDELSPDEKEIWRETATSEPDGWFDTAAKKAMLKDYCRHRGEAERISVIIYSFQAEWLKTAEGCHRYRELTKVRDAECRAAGDKATKLRMTNQSRYTPQGAAGAARRHVKERLPWEKDDEET
jgi:hypothetical protein